MPTPTPTPTPTSTPTPTPTPTRWWDIGAQSVHVATRVLDAQLDDVARSDRVIACQGMPRTYGEADTLLGEGGMKLAEGEASFSVPFSQGDHRAMRLYQVVDVPVLSPGVWDYVALVDDDEGELKASIPSDFTSLVSTDGDSGTVTILGDRTSSVGEGDPITIRGNGSLEGEYTVVEAYLHDNNAHTVVAIQEEVVTTDGPSGFCLYDPRRLRDGSRVTTRSLDITSIVPSV